MGRGMTLSNREVHAEGRFPRTLFTLKMLLSRHLVGGKSILTDQNISPARFFLFGNGNFFWQIGRFCPDFRHQILVHRVQTGVLVRAGEAPKEAEEMKTPVMHGSEDQSGSR